MTDLRDTLDGLDDAITDIEARVGRFERDASGQLAALSREIAQLHQQHAELRQWFSQVASLIGLQLAADAATSPSCVAESVAATW